MTEPAPSFLLAALARAVCEEHALPHIDPEAWPALLQLAERHRVVALLAARFADQALPDPALARALAQARLRNQASERRNALALADMIDALRSADLWCLALKGTSIAERYYRQPSDRNAVDIDILVEEAALGAAIEQVERLGFIPIGAMAAEARVPTAGQRAAAADMPFVRAGDRTKLELHWRLSRNRNLPPWPTEALKHHVAEFAAPCGSLPVLAPPALLFYLTCHGSRHLWFRLKWLVDIDRIVRALSVSDLREAAALARRYGCERLFHTSLDLARLCFGTPTDSVLDRAQSHPALLRDMLTALEDPTATRNRYGLRDLRAAGSKLRGRVLLRPDGAYRRELARHMLVDVDDLAPGRATWRSVAAKLGRKLGRR